MAPLPHLTPGGTAGPGPNARVLPVDDSGDGGLGGKPAPTGPVDVVDPTRGQGGPGGPGGAYSPPPGSFGWFMQMLTNMIQQPTTLTPVDQARMAAQSRAQSFSDINQFNQGLSRLFERGSFGAGGVDPNLMRLQSANFQRGAGGLATNLAQMEMQDRLSTANRNTGLLSQGLNTALGVAQTLAPIFGNTLFPGSTAEGAQSGGGGASSAPGFKPGARRTTATASGSGGGGRSTFSGALGSTASRSGNSTFGGA